MKSVPVQLDKNLDVLHDDRGRLVILPRDHRRPIRLSGGDAPLVSIIQKGNFSLDDRGSEPSLTEGERTRLLAIVNRLDQQGLLLGRGRPPESRTIRLKLLTRIYDASASCLVAPLTGLSIKRRGQILTLATLSILVGLIALWGYAEGRIFIGLATSTWWLGIIVYLLAFPVIHEFSHAFVARLFGLEVTSVGLQHRGGFSWSPFVEARYAVLSSDPIIRLWVPLAGVVCNLLLALLMGLWLLVLPPNSPLHGMVAILLVFMHARVLIDGGFGMKADASQALQAVKEFGSPKDYRQMVCILRGGYALFLLSTIVMLALTLGTAGARI